MTQLHVILINTVNLLKFGTPEIIFVIIVKFDGCVLTIWWQKSVGSFVNGVGPDQPALFAHAYHSQ